MKKNTFAFLRGMLVALMTTFMIGVGCDTSTTPTAPPPMPVTLRGVNLTGAEWEWKAGVTPVQGTNYEWVSHQDIDYLTSKGFTYGRLLFSWEILQPALNGPFASTYFNTLIDRVNYATSKGMWIMIEPHGGASPGFARYKGNTVGSTAVPNSAFADLWARLATQFKDNPRVVFGLMNEPNNIGTMQWYGAAQAAITGIRGTTAANVIMVEGNGWSQPSSWNDTWYDTSATKVSNATGWSTLSDPLKRTVVSVHCYFDADGGGGGDDVVSADILVKRLQPVVTWARAKGLKVHLSEFGANAATVGAQAAVDYTLKYIDANQDVMLGWSWWAYGPPAWWGGYHFTLDPKSNYTVDDPKLAWLKPYFKSPESPVVDASTSDSATTPVADASVIDAAAPVSSKPTEPIPFTKGTVFTTSSGTTNWVYVPTTYDSTHSTPTKLFVWLHGCGGKSQYDVSMVSPGGTQDWISLAPGGREGACWSSLSTDGPKILAAIADLKKHFNIDPRRVVLGGYSSGGDIGYPMIFTYANMFAGALFENTGSSSTALTLAKTAAWKLNIVHLAHTGDTTYPITTIRSNMTTLKNLGFPVTLIERTGTHWDNDTSTSGTTYDLKKYLLPYLNAGWTTPGDSSPPPPAPVDAGTIVDAGVIVDSGVIVDAGVVVDSGTDAGTRLVLIVTAVKTYDWGTGYCKQFYFENRNAVPVAWKTMTIYLNDGKLRGASGVWGAVFPNPTATGKVVVTPVSWTSPIGAGKKVQTVGFCADYGPTKYVGTNGGLTY